MRKLIVIAVFFMLSVPTLFGQQITKYEYAEVIVLQKTDKNKSEFKQAYLNSTTDSNLNASDFKGITSNADVLKFMNNKDWVFVERISTQPTNSVPLWISYIFRKKI